MVFIQPKMLQKMLEMANDYTTVDSISQVMNAIQILELEADEIKDIYLGGYIE